MSDSVTLIYALPAFVRTRNLLDDVERQNEVFRQTAIDLSQRLDEHGVEDGYVIAMRGMDHMVVVAETPACALLLKCWGGYLPRLEHADA